ncbi:hypothetical protein [Algibacter lectus]|uniref:Uncharacterized protein n=1 Tax=Algibacter lectus TaxID=221126 RepID=A0A4R8MEC1_9FLAO|nr:hypothetical protein [Algibacter lectus]MWW26845.1 hypothetical protein [Algibacter lectus]TDY64210.1 hypothetical protein DFQ06_1115 [Algibacter lectus]
MYYKVKISSDPKIIGVNNGVYQVEIKPKTSFEGKIEEKKFDDYFDKPLSYFRSNKYKPIDKKEVKTITFIPLKKAKETDFVSYSPNVNAMLGLFSDNLMTIISEFKLPSLIKIDALIKGFKKKYFFVGLPILDMGIIDFSNSTFSVLKSGEILSLNNKEEYIEKVIINDLYRSSKLMLKENIDFDMFYLQSEGLFFSKNLISKLEKEGITGLEIKSTSLVIKPSN